MFARAWSSHGFVAIGVLAAASGCGGRTGLLVSGDGRDTSSAGAGNDGASGAGSGGGAEGTRLAVDAAGDLEAGATALDGGPCSAGACKGALALSAGDGQTCALLSVGTVECWGDNEQGELGNGTTTNGSYAIPTPAPVANLTGVTAIAAGAAHTCALLSGGMVRCWGDNEVGQLGSGTPNSPFAIPVSNLTGVTAIAAGALHTCALLSTGTVECWGAASDGQLGTWMIPIPNPASAFGSWTPVPVSNLTGVTALSAGDSHTCAILADRTVQCWGNNDYGQLGNGTTHQSTTPVAVSNLSGVTAIASGKYHACAVLSGGAVECWGANDYGQLGNATTTNSSTPVNVPL